MGRVAAALIGVSAILLVGPTSAFGSVATACDLRSVEALRTPNMHVRSVVAIAAVAQQPSYCDVEGLVSTDGDGAGAGAAGFEIKLPENWNHKFLFWGAGGLAGTLTPGANSVDLQLALPKGYATAVTDAGHEGYGPSWALMAPHKLDEPRLIDYWYRAAHAVTVAGKALVERYYAGAIAQAYFDGCSNGGRMALMEAMRYPEDYDGIVAGAPWLDLRTQLAGYKNVEAFFDHFIPRDLLSAISGAVLESCDGLDGVADGLIQNPARCVFDPQKLVCTSDQTGRCLSQDQATALSIYLRAVSDLEGRVVFPGQPVSDLGDEGGLIPWVETQQADPALSARQDISPLASAWLITKAIAKVLGESSPQAVVDAPQEISSQLAHYVDMMEMPLAWEYADWILRYLMAQDPSFRTLSRWAERGGVVSSGMLRRFDEAVAAGNVDRPERLGAFLSRGGKIILYHGFSDPGISPFRTIMFYRDLARQHGGYAAARKQVRLFMVPGMLHCGGGNGPNQFDTLSPLERWVEAGLTPDGIIATGSSNGRNGGVPRTMPLCAFPDAAVHKGAGDVNDANNWSCTANGDLLQSGPNGHESGLEPTEGR